jgi:excisionase family DNA binding protein
MEKVEALLEDIKGLLQQNKCILNADEACAFLGISKNYLYRLTAQGKVKYYRPFGKRIFIDREELLNTLRQNEVKSQKEISGKATDYLSTPKSKKYGSSK